MLSSPAASAALHINSTLHVTGNLLLCVAAACFGKLLRLRVAIKTEGFSFSRWKRPSRVPMGRAFCRAPQLSVQGTWFIERFFLYHDTVAPSTCYRIRSTWREAGIFPVAVDLEIHGFTAIVAGGGSVVGGVDENGCSGVDIKVFEYPVAPLMEEEVGESVEGLLLVERRLGGILGRLDLHKEAVEKLPVAGVVSIGREGGGGNGNRGDICGGGGEGSGSNLGGVLLGEEEKAAEVVAGAGEQWWWYLGRRRRL
ncbi:hypothetical protein Nepgr_005445 [Nepenthes gracilis]|uniref:Uncharacterized protein n=1 Tax=Nepenthes gracilis TaxID=150966 RepID=A0AAD3S3I7_NEPGR|nr:hypothetical protein Nepgr_005445 [Nepenthes gracilis]